jgi:uncharacterized membrane protein
MEWLKNHLREKFLAGVLAAVPIVIVVWAAVTIEQNTQFLATKLNLQVPGLGILIAVVGIYLLGLAVTSFLGRFALRLADHILQKVPGLSLLYRAWKDVLVVPPDKAGTFHEVVLVPNQAGGAQVGFTSGRPLPGDPGCICVFLPGIPNPLSGRLVIVERAQCMPLKLSMEEAFKFLLSTGNYLPPELQGMTADRLAQGEPRGAPLTPGP